MLGYDFNDPSLLVEAMTHGSYQIAGTTACYQVDLEASHFLKKHRHFYVLFFQIIHASRMMRELTPFLHSLLTHLIVFLHQSAQLRSFCLGAAAAISNGRNR
jgi:hypothetical protein